MAERPVPKNIWVKLNAGLPQGLEEWVGAQAEQTVKKRRDDKTFSFS